MHVSILVKSSKVIKSSTNQEYIFTESGVGKAISKLKKPKLDLDQVGRELDAEV